MTVRAFSYGGGVQSTAALVLAARGEIDYPLFIYANVGDDHEPETLAYVRDHAEPFAVDRGVELIELRKRRRDGSPDSLLGRIERTRASIPIPARGPDGAPFRRVCTSEFKIRVVDAELRRRADGGETRTGLGITMDENHRASNARADVEYPLLDLRLYRDDCERIIRDAGLPVPAKSACYFCPFSSLDRWRELKQNRPERFRDAVAVERRLQERRVQGGRSPVYLTRYGRNLDDVVDDQLLLDLDDGCESGYCMT